ncbi:MAG: ABC transporter transmembrane domain-containing protein, partial [Chloroflexota bacterium]
MGFVMEGLQAEGYDRQYHDRELIRRIIGYFRPKLPTMLFVAGMVVLNATMDTVLPVMLSRAVDTLSINFTWQAALLLSFVILVAGALSWSFNYLRQVYTARAVGDVQLQLRQDVFASILNRDMSFYDEYISGRIVSRVTGDTTDFSNVVTLTLNLMSQLLLVGLLLIVMFFINWQLTLLALLIAPMITAAALTFRHIARRSSRSSQRARATVNAHLQETLSGISVAKNFRQEDTIYDEFQDINQQAYSVNLREGFVYSTIFPVLAAIGGIGTVIVVYFGGNSAIAGNISPGDWFLFVQAMNIFWFPMTSIASFWSQFQLGLSASERVFALMDSEPRVYQTDNQSMPTMKGEIEFRDVQFRYTEQEQVLPNFNLTIEAGETIALVGHTGAGKSSLGKLVARFYEFQAGKLLVDGRDVRTLDLGEYRRHIGMVPQTPFLFAGTVSNNIRYSRPDATDEEVAAVAASVGLGDWVDALPDGLDTDVGEGGRALSMGQRQLVALARVLHEDPSVIILDEATASIDPVTEAQIQEGLDVILKDRTAIVIAHRLSTVRNADRIIVLSQGEIIELAKYFGFEPMFEDNEQNPYLMDFYSDMPRWSFNLQLSFLQSRLKKLNMIRSEARNVVQDRTIYEDAQIFAPNLHAMGPMETRDFETYKELFETITELIQPPDLLIYLRAGIPTL